MIKQEKWEIRVPEGSNGYVQITRDNGLFEENVCTLYGNIRGTKKNNALVDSVTMQDARMIAAAPVMYAVLQFIYEGKADISKLPALFKLIETGEKF